MGYYISIFIFCFFSSILISLRNSLIGVASHVEVVEYEIKAAALVSGADIDHTLISLPLEYGGVGTTAQGNHQKEDNSPSLCSLWKDLFLRHDCDIESLPRNKDGYYQLSGVCKISLFTRLFSLLFSQEFF